MFNWTSSLVLAALVTLFPAGCGGEGPDSGTAQPDQGQPAPQTRPQDASQEKQRQDLPAPVIEGLARAQKEQKVLVVQFHDGECNFCHDMDMVLDLDSIKQKLQEFVFVTVEMRRDEGAMKYARDNYLGYSPTFLPYKPDGTQIDYSLEGFQPEQVFLVELENFKLLAAGKDLIDPPVTDHENYGKG